MWNKSRTEPETPVAAAVTAEPKAAPAGAPAVPVVTAAPAAPAARPVENNATATIGKSVVVKGDVSGTEDLFIDGRVEGSVDVSGQTLTIGPNAVIHGPLVAQHILIMGNVTGSVTASAKVTVHKHGSLEGNISAPTVSLADGGIVNGRIDTVSDRKKNAAPVNLPIAV